MNNIKDDSNSINLKYFGVISLIPEIFSGWLNHGVIGRAFDNDIVSIDMVNPRAFSKRSSNAVDDKPYGGGPGMLMQLQPVYDAIDSLKDKAPKKTRKILLAPHGKKFTQDSADNMLNSEGVILICGRYEGIDSRIELENDIEVWSIGDFVLSGGELAAMVMMETMVRMIPKVLGDPNSAAEDSFSHSNKYQLDYPHYTRPVEFKNQFVPQILLKGDHKAIRSWRKTQAIGRMWHMRPDLVHNSAPLSKKQWQSIYEYIQSLSE